MIEIGKKQLRIVKTMTGTRDGRRVLEPKIENGQTVTRLVANEPVRVTRAALGSAFCKDNGRRLVVKLADGDLLELRPQGTRQRVSAPIADIYHWILRSKAFKEQMARLREIKARKEQARAERRLRHPLK